MQCYAGIILLSNDSVILIRYCIGLERDKCLTHWGRVTHICVGKITIIGSDNGLSPERRQAMIWTNAGILLIGPLRTNFSEIFIGIQTFSFKKMHLKMSSAKLRPFCLGLNVLTHLPLETMAAILSWWSKRLVFWLKFHWSLFLRVELTTSIDLDSGLAPNKRQPLSEPMLARFTDAYMRH